MKTLQSILAISILMITCATVAWVVYVRKPAPNSSPEVAGTVKEISTHKGAPYAINLEKDGVWNARVWFGSETPVCSRFGLPTEIKIGDDVSVWTTGPVLDIKPGGHRATYIRVDLKGD